MIKSGFFADFADGGLFSVLAWFDMTLRNRPAVFRILNEKDFDIFLIFREAKNNPARGRLANDFFNNRFFLKNGFAEFIKGRGFILFRKSLRNFTCRSPLGYWLL